MALRGLGGKRKTPARGGTGSALPFAQHREVSRVSGCVESQREHDEAQDASGQVFPHSHLQTEPGRGAGHGGFASLYTLFGHHM